MNRVFSLSAGLVVGLIGILTYALFFSQNPAPTVAVNSETQPQIAKDLRQAPVAATGASATTPVLGPAPTPRRLPSSKARSKLEDYLAQQDPAAAWTIHRDHDGRPTGIMGGKILVGGGPKALQDRINELAPFLLGHSADLRWTEKHVTTSLSQTQTLEQRAAGFAVYGGFLRVSYSLDESQIYEVASDLRPVKEVDTTQNFTFAEAQQLIERQEARRGILRINGDAEPYVYGESPSRNELVWRFHLSTSLPSKNSREILISAKDGRKLMDRSVLRR